jgi:hypothetical protein
MPTQELILACIEHAHLLWYCVCIIRSAVIVVRTLRRPAGRALNALRGAMLRLLLSRLIAIVLGW